MLGTSAVVLRAYVPNEQAWVCDLLLRVAKPKLLGKAMERINMGRTDQCSQEQVPCLGLSLSLWAQQPYLVFRDTYFLRCVDGVGRSKGGRAPQRPSLFMCLA